MQPVLLKSKYKVFFIFDNLHYLYMYTQAKAQYMIIVLSSGLFLAYECYCDRDNEAEQH